MRTKRSRFQSFFWLFSRLVGFISFSYVSLLFSSIFFLAFVSLFPVESFPLLFFLQLIFFVFTFFTLKRFLPKFSPQKITFTDLIVLVPFVLVILLRFPLYFPFYDDFVGHLVAGDYAFNFWGGDDFLSLGFPTYLYPLQQVVYVAPLRFLGIRFSLLLNSLILVLWFWSLNLRFKELFRNRLKSFVLNLFFVYLFFIPRLMATHVSFMVDFVSLILAIETLYWFLSNKKDKTFAVLIGVLAIILKQSSGIFFVPLYICLFLMNFKKIKWKWLLLLSFFVGIYFLKNYFETGNPVAFLYNGFFKSSLYSLSNFRDLKWGPRNLKELIIWPLIGSLGDRYGGGWVSLFSRYFFLSFTAFPYLMSIFLFLFKRKIEYLVIFLSFLFWGMLSGYSRYQLSMSSVSWLLILWFWRPRKIFKKGRKIFYAISFLFLVLFIVPCFNSIQTDFGWRPQPFFQVLKNPPSTWKYFFFKYQEGLDLIFKDRILDIANYYKDDFRDYDAVMVFSRGENTLYSYFAHVNGLPVATAINSDQYREIMKDKKISAQIKKNLEEIYKVDRIMLVATKDREDGDWMKDLFLAEKFKCQKNGYGERSPFFQNPYYFKNLVLFTCDKKD